MKKAAAAYTISNAMHRGAVWITLPLLAAVFDQTEMGIYALAQTVATVLAPLICLNGGAAILREGSTHYASGTRLLRSFSALGLVLAAVLVTAFELVPIAGYDWLGLACLLALSTGLYSNVLADYQARNQFYRYLIHASIKGGLISAAIFVAWYEQLDARGLLSLQCCGLFTHAFLLVLLRSPARVNAPPGSDSTDAEGSQTTLNSSATNASMPMVSFGAALAFTIPLIPHSLAQWVMSSSDRFILKFRINDAAVGEYTLAFAITALLVLFNAGIGTALPRFAIRNYARWSRRETRRRVILGYTLLALAAAFTTIGIIRLSAHYSDELATRLFDPWQKYNVTEVEFMVTWLLAGQYLLGLYQIYATYLFYHRRTGQLSLQTLCGAMVNVVLTLMLVSRLGTRGAAVATVGGYFVYLLLVLSSLGTVEKSLRRHALQESAVFVSACGLLLAAAMYF